MFKWPRSKWWEMDRATHTWATIRDILYRLRAPIRTWAIISNNWSRLHTSWKSKARQMRTPPAQTLLAFPASFLYPTVWILWEIPTILSRLSVIIETFRLGLMKLVTPRWWLRIEEITVSKMRIMVQLEWDSTLKFSACQAHLIRVMELLEYKLHNGMVILMVSRWGPPKDQELLTRLLKGLTWLQDLWAP